MGEKIHPMEYRILNQMDAAFCDETNIELKAYQERQLEKSKQGNK